MAFFALARLHLFHRLRLLCPSGEGPDRSKRNFAGPRVSGGARETTGSKSILDIANAFLVESIRPLPSSRLLGRRATFDYSNRWAGCADCVAVALVFLLVAV